MIPKLFDVLERIATGIERLVALSETPAASKPAPRRKDIETAATRG